MEKAAVKGTAVVPTYNYIVKHYGEEGWEKLLTKLDKKDRMHFDRKLLVGIWYPFGSFVALLRAIKELFGKDDEYFLFKMGEHSAEDGLSSVYRFFLRIGSPGFVISRGAKVWSSYYRGGDMQTIKNEKGHGIVRLIGWEEPAKEHCERVRGWIKKALEISGAKEVVVRETHCICDGDDYCEYDMRWK